MQNIYHYSKKSILQDYGRGSLGAALTGIPLLFLNLHPIIFPLFLAGFALFIFFLIRTSLKQKTRLIVDSTKNELIEQHFYTKKLHLDALEEVNLRYYSMHRRAKKSTLPQEPLVERGWFSLKLRDKQKNAITVESSLENFQEFIDNIISYLKTTSVNLNPITISNFEALGYNING